MAAKTKIEKAMTIYVKYSHMDSAKVKAKIAAACDMSPESASSYYYNCKNHNGSTATRKAQDDAKLLPKSSAARRKAASR